MARYNENGLTEKQQSFCDYFLADPKRNATAAAIRAGYSRNTAEQMASKLMANKKIKTYIDARLAELTADVKLEQEDVLRDLMELRDMCLGRKPMPQALIVDGKAIDLEVTKVDVNGAKGSLELLGKYLKMWTDKVEHSGNIGMKQILEDIDGQDNGLPDAPAGED